MMESCSLAQFIKGLQAGVKDLPIAMIEAADNIEASENQAALGVRRPLVRIVECRN